MEVLDQSAVADMLDTASVMHLGCVDGGAYVTALSYVMLDGEIYFRTFAGRRLSAIRNDPRVAIEISEVDDQTGRWASVVADGTARIVEEPVTKVRVEGALAKKYAKAYSDLIGGAAESPTGEAYVVGIELSDISGRSSGAGWRQTRPGRM